MLAGNGNPNRAPLAGVVDLSRAFLREVPQQENGIKPDRSRFDLTGGNGSRFGDCCQFKLDSGEPDREITGARYELQIGNSNRRGLRFSQPHK